MMIKLPVDYELKIRLMARHLGVSVEECIIDLIDGTAKNMNVVLIPPHQIAVVAGALILLMDHRYYVFNKDSAIDLRDNLRLAVDRRKRHNNFEIDGVTWMRQSAFHEILSADADPRYTIVFTHELAKDVLDQTERMVERAEN